MKILSFRLKGLGVKPGVDVHYQVKLLSIIEPNKKKKKSEL